MNVCTLMGGTALIDMPVFWVALGLSLFVASLATREDAEDADDADDAEPDATDPV